MFLNTCSIKPHSTVVYGSIVTMCHLSTLNDVARAEYAPAPREPAGRFTSHGPVDSALLHQKMWVSEDDSRTVLASKGSWDQHVNTTAGTVNLLRRNMYSAMLHRQAVYWLDLESKGWWGRDDNASMVAATDAIWANASHVLRQWQTLLSSQRLQAQLLPSAEVAIFVDEVSAAARPGE